MRFLIVSDIHGNFDALQAVLSHAKGKFEQIVCCGDLVGYCAQPHEVVQWARTSVTAIVRGNHDRVCAGIDDVEEFNPIAAQAVLWTRAQLNEGEQTYLSGLPKGPILFDEYELAHGSPINEDDYLTDVWDVADLGDRLMRKVCFIGHTHVQGGWVFQRSGPQKIPVSAEVEQHTDRFYLINPGSAGQPRDGDPRAAYLIWDSEARIFEFQRVEYDVDAAQARIIKAGLPKRLADRLALGR